MSGSTLLIGGIALVAAGGSIGALYYSRKADSAMQAYTSNLSKMQSQLNAMSPEISDLQSEVSSLGSSIPEINSELSRMQSEENANNSLLQKLQPEISAVSAMNSRLASMESTITSLPADFTGALKALQAQIPIMLANFGASLKNLPVFQSLMKDESSIANQVNTSYLIVKTLGSSIETEVGKSIGKLQTSAEDEYNYIASLIKQFQTALNVLQANISALPSDLRTGVVNSLTPELNSIEGDISPIISTIDGRLSPIENNINSIKSSVSGLGSDFSGIGSDVRSAVYSIF